MTITFSTENYAQVIDEIRPLNERHWEEIAVYEDIPLAPDYAVYQALDDAGRLVIVTVRDDGRLVGYSIYFLRLHAHYRDTLCAASDIFWLHPDYRRGRIGWRLFQKVEEVLVDCGAVIMHTTTKTAHPAAERMLESLGHIMVEKGYSKRLG